MTTLDQLSTFTPALMKQLDKLGLKTVQQLVLYFPIRYEDETKIHTVSEINIGQMAQLQGEVVSAEVTYRPRKALQARLADATGEINLRFLHFYPNTIKALNEGEKVRVYGEVRQGYWGLEMVHPKIRKPVEAAALPTALSPVYRTVAGLSQSRLHKVIQQALEWCNTQMPSPLAEILPVEIYQLPQLERLPSFDESVLALHQPPNSIDTQSLQVDSAYWRRLAYDELLAQQLLMQRHYQRRSQLAAPAMQASKKLVSQLLKQLPFQLTMAQQKVALEIQTDLMQAHPMQRLLQGDVGSGKTIVACMAALQAVENGYQVALMAPTEILAEQHYQKFSQWLSALSVKVEWLVGNQSKAIKSEALDKISNGMAQITVGTHAIFQDNVVFDNLGLAIIDEQHRFGVQQRLALRQKGKNAGEQRIHQLMMSATPIPRTLSMSYYADLDVSVIDELPPGRTPITTKLISEQRRADVIASVKRACETGKQAYWVCPLIEESEALQLATANDTYAAMQAAFPQLKLGLIHGRLHYSEKKAVMEAFARGDTQLLVATTVIEVGVDVPNASLMVIEHAERMGLSQLHQLRGRVGRGAAKSTCVLLYQNKLSETAKARLKVIYENNDGFAIAAADLKLRGPGEFMGVRQSGLPMLRFADLERDQDLITLAQQSAQQLLASDHQTEIDSHLERWLGHVDQYVEV